MTSYIPWLYPAHITHLQALVLLLLFAGILLLNIIRESRKRKAHKQRMREYRKVREEV